MGKERVPQVVFKKAKDWAVNDAPIIGVGMGVGGLIGVNCGEAPGSALIEIGISAGSILVSSGMILFGHGVFNRGQYSETTIVFPVEDNIPVPSKR